MPSLSLALDYVHVNTVHLERIRDANLFPATVGADTGSPAQQRPIYSTSVRPNPNYGQLLSQESSAHSNYDGVTLGFNKRMTHHLQFLLNGTLAWNRDDDSNERNYSGITMTMRTTSSRNIRGRASTSGASLSVDGL